MKVIDSLANQVVTASSQKGQRAVPKASLKTQPSDFRIVMLIQCSDTSETEDWEILQAQWQITSFRHYKERITDTFRNHPKRVYEVTNIKTKKVFEMGPDDIKYLFSDGRDRIRNYKGPRYEHSGTFTPGAFNMDLADFGLQIIRVVEWLTKASEFELRERLGCLSYLIDYLQDEDKRRVCETVKRIFDSRDAPAGRLYPADRNFLMYKPLERCMDYEELSKHFPHLKNVVDAKFAKTERPTIAEKVFMIRKRGTSGADRMIETEAKEQLREKTFSYWDIYQMECEYQGEET